MHVGVGAVALTELGSPAYAESTATIRARVAAARQRQLVRFRKLRGVSCNAHAPGRWIDAHGSISSEARALLQQASGSLALSARGYHRVLKVSRTIADLDGEEEVRNCHVAEAIRYRPSGGRS